ncbi:MAG TPA: hypothetical protein VJ743_08035 [Albitalea sp.]|nr:hypothetical protein [Albitalea sp.]
MNDDRFKPPAAQVRDRQPRQGVSHWLAVPAGFLLSALGVFVLEPMLVDLIVQYVLSLAPTSQQTPMLLLDLLLSTLTLMATFHFTAWWSRKPRIRASLSVALLLLAAIALIDQAEAASMPLWYDVGTVAGIAIAWIVSNLLVLRGEPS